MSFFSRDLVKEFLGIQKDYDLNQWIERFGWTSEQSVIFVTSQEDKVKVS